MKTNRHLVVFAKAPHMGRVKTRLGKDIGIVPATNFYRLNIKRILSRLSMDNRWNCWIALNPDSEIWNKAFWPDNFTAVRQGSGDIGQRMGRIMQTMPPGPVVIIGADVPGIYPQHIVSAYKALGFCDVVFGPSVDGGYWLVGAKRTPRVPEIFKIVRWSTKFTLSDTLTQTRQKQLKFNLLKSLVDIDDGFSYQMWIKDAL